jgi:ketosteroid isomerase-like protein
MSEENVALVTRVLDTLRYATVEEMTDEVLADGFDRDVAWLPVVHGPLIVDRYTGLEGIRQFYTAFLATWEDVGAHPDAVRDAGDQVATSLRMTGHRDHVPCDERWSVLWTIENHHITRVEGFPSPSGASQAMGLEE